MVAFVIVLEILLPTVVLGCFRRRKYMEMLAIKIIRSILTLPFLFWVVQAHLTIIKMINDTILSGYFLGCNEIFMQSQRVLAAENAKDTRLMPRSRPASGL